MKKYTKIFEQFIVIFLSRALGTTPLSATAAMPGSTMKIFYGEPGDSLVAENVKIGDPLTLVVGIDDQVKKNIVVFAILVLLKK